MNLKFRVFGDLHYLDEIPNWPEKRKLVEYADIILDKLIESTNNNNELSFIIKIFFFIFYYDYIFNRTNIWEESFQI